MKAATDNVQMTGWDQAPKNCIWYGQSDLTGYCRGINRGLLKKEKNVEK